MLFWLVIFAVLFVLVIWNIRRNNSKLRSRKGRSFRTNFYEKKKEREKQN